ncbi:MAG TPA: hypothetical protein DCS93_41050 [Microscillaceae bacterium]|nr:hypothetical protein [Microscillaceae bacterium]
MNNLSQFAQPFVGSEDLRVSIEGNLLTIHKIRRFRWIQIAGTLIMFSTLAFFTGLVAVMAIQENKPSYFWIVLLFLAFVVAAFYMLKGALFSRQKLVLNLTDNTATVYKNHKKPVQHHFNEIIQWQLVGKVFRQYRGGTGVMSQLYLRLKDEPPKHKPIEVFVIYPSLDLRTSLTTNMKKLLPLMKKSAQENGEEVAKRLQNATQIPWRWYEYNDTY